MPLVSVAPALIEQQLLGAVEPECAMHRRNDDAAFGKVCAHDAAKLLLSCGVERAGRLVKEPHRAFHGEKAGDRKAPPLACGKVGGGEVDKRLEPDRGKRLRNFGGGAEKTRPEAEVLADRKRRFQRILVAEIMGLLADRQFRVASCQIEPSGGDAHQANNHAQQG